MKYQLFLKPTAEMIGDAPDSCLLKIESDDREYLEAVLQFVEPLFESAWINDFDPLRKPDAPNPPSSMQGGWNPQKKELHRIIASDVLPNGGVLIYHLVDALHEYIARTARPSGQTASTEEKQTRAF